MRLTRIRGWDGNERNASNRALIGRKLFQLIIRPTVQTTTLRLPDFGTISNASQILKRNRCLKLLSFCYQLFRDVVVDPMRESVVLSQRAVSRRASRPSCLWIEAMP